MTLVISMPMSIRTFPENGGTAAGCQAVAGAAAESGSG